MMKIIRITITEGDAKEKGLSFNQLVTAKLTLGFKPLTMSTYAHIGRIMDMEKIEFINK